MIEEQTYEEVLDAIVAADSRYQHAAYHFVRDGLGYTQQSISQKETVIARHISGQELLEGMRAYALEQYGPMALMVLGEWGIRRCEDFGEIVFNMVEYELLAKTDEDSRDDFKGGYDFEDVFQKPFLPPRSPGQSSVPGSRNITPVSDENPDRSGHLPEPEASDK